MGNSSRSPEDYELVSKFREGDWTQQPSEEGVQVWRNRITKESAVLVRLGGVPGSEDLDVYTTRTMENDLVKVHHLLIDKHSDFCSLYSSAQLLVEHTPVRLPSLRNFDREEALTIFSAALRAFHLIQLRFGPVVPREELVGFNEQGRAKVWVNRNSALNCADQINLSEDFKATGRRVQLLFEMIEQRARCVLLPPVIKREICHPLTSHLSALKTLEKFAYFEKLNLRKYLQLGNNQASVALRPQRNRARNRSYLTEARPQHQVQCEQSGSKQDQLRLNYSLNNIHNQQAAFCVSPQMAARRSDLQSMFRRSVISNNTSPIESARPSLVHFANHAPPSPQETAAFPPRLNQVSIKPQADFQTEHIQTHPETPADKQDKKQIDQTTKKEQNAVFDKKEQGQQGEIIVNNKKLSIIDKIAHQFADQIRIKQFESIDEPVNQGQIQPKSPTFVQNQQIKYELPSFAPSQQNFDEIEGAQVHHNFKGNELNSGLLQDRMNNILFRQQQEQAKRMQQQDEQRRLSIQQKAPKLVFTPDFVLNPGSLLNYCTSVQSKLHMATNRQHSIIERQNDALELKAKQDQKHSKVKRIQSKYIAVRQKSSNIHQNRHQTHKYQSKISRLAGEQDFLDVNFLQKSLDKRYNNQQQHLKLAQKKRQMQLNDALNIARLQEGLLKFSKSQLSQKNSDVPSRQQIPLSKKSQHIEFTVQRSTGVESYRPFREKRNNQDTSYEDPYLHLKQLNRVGDRRSSKYHQLHHRPPCPDQQRQFEDNINQYSFEQNRRNTHFANQTQLSTNEYNLKQKSASRLISKPARPRASAEEEEEEEEEEKAGRSSQSKRGASRKISYEQLVQFLWN